MNVVNGDNDDNGMIKSIMWAHLILVVPLTPRPRSGTSLDGGCDRCNQSGGGHVSDFYPPIDTQKSTLTEGLERINSRPPLLFCVLATWYYI